jgi:hypothetical protein
VILLFARIRLATTFCSLPGRVLAGRRAAGRFEAMLHGSIIRSCGYLPVSASSSSSSTNMNDEHSNGNRVELTLVELRAVIRMVGWSLKEPTMRKSRPAMGGRAAARSF